MATPAPAHPPVTEPGPPVADHVMAADGTCLALGQRDGESMAMYTDDELRRLTAEEKADAWAECAAKAHALIPRDSLHLLSGIVRVEQIAQVAQANPFLPDSPDFPAVPEELPVSGLSSRARKKVRRERELQARAHHAHLFAASSPRAHHYRNGDGTCHAGDLFEAGTSVEAVFGAQELVRVLNAEKAEAWDRCVSALSQIGVESQSLVALRAANHYATAPIHGGVAGVVG